MKTYQLNRLAKARVWQRRDPFDATERPEFLAVELWIPHGASAEYGLLGASLDHEQFGVRLTCPRSDGRWAGSLAEGLDDVRRGLPEEYRESVIREAQAVIAERAMDIGVTYDTAAHGAIGSSSALFGRLAVTVIDLLTIGEESPGDERTEALLRTALQPRS